MTLDSRHARGKETSRGSGYVFPSARASVNWRTSLIKLVTKSKCKCEHVGLSQAKLEMKPCNLIQLKRGMRFGKLSVLLFGDDDESSLKLGGCTLRFRKMRCVKTVF